ncbi:MAG: hypothetical protein QXL57_03515 [Candidatus Bathyarchaeia archaeon]
MPEIDVEFIQPLPEPKEGETYAIETVEHINKTPLRGLEAWRATLCNVRDGSLCATMLWKRERVGPNSKLGAFISVLGRNTDLWVGRKVKFLAWKHRDRKVEAVISSDAAQKDSISTCKKRLVETLEKGKAYTVADAKSAGLGYPDDVITSAFELLVSEGRAFKIPTTPTRYFFEG